MEDVRDVLPIGSLTGKVVISLATGNKLGSVRDLFIDPINGLMVGLTLTGVEGTLQGLAYEDAYSIGHDAVMARSDETVKPIEELRFAGFPRANDLVGTSIITVSGNVLGNIGNVFVTLQQEPLVVYSIREGVLDKLLGREHFILASAGHALSADGERLIVPDETADSAERSIEELLHKAMSIRTFEPGVQPVRPFSDDNDTVLVNRDDEDETIVRSDDEDTVIRLRTDLDPHGQVS